MKHLKYHCEDCKSFGTVAPSTDRRCLHDKSGGVICYEEGEESIFVCDNFEHNGDDI